MRIELAAFTEQGRRLGERLAGELSRSGDGAELERIGGGVTLREWVDARFDRCDALVFIGAAGIAVRAVGPRLVSKTTDPAVVVVDDCGRFAIPLLSGHMGGANDLALRIAGMLGAVPVITTATDANNVFAIDVWAKKNNVAILNPEAVKTVSAALLGGSAVRLRCAFPVAGALPKGLVLVDGDEADVSVDVRLSNRPGMLRLVPPALVLGVGCRKGTPERALDEAFLVFCQGAGIAPQAFRKVCSIDLKQNEQGLAAFCRNRGLPFETYSAAELGVVAGDFESSPFVKSVAGVDNVCERSAVRGGGGRLFVCKTVMPGVTMAAALDEYRISF